MCLPAVPLSCAAAAVVTAQTTAGERAGRDWPGFRGVATRGVDESATVPLRWNVPESQGSVVWNDRVCTESAVSGTPGPQLKAPLQSYQADL